MFVLRQDHVPQISSQQPHTQLVPPEFLGAPTPNPNSKVVKAVLITIAIFLGLGVIGFGVIGFGMWYLAKSVHRVPSAMFTESDLGIAIYPGAEPSMSGSRTEIAGKQLVNAAYFTRDSVDQVVAFYKEMAGSNARLTTTPHGARLRISAAAGVSIVVDIMRISDAAGGRTRISILKATQAATSR